MGLTTFLYLAVARWGLCSFQTPGTFWLNPLVFPIAVWTMSYPIWAIVRSPALPLGPPFGVEDVDLETRMLVVLFATLFVALLGISVRLLVPHRARRIDPIAAAHVRRREKLLIHLLFVAVSSAWLLRFSWGSMFGLYEEYEQLTHSFGENLVSMIAGAIWFALPGCLLAYGVSRTKMFLVESMVLSGLVVVYAAVSTSKGALLNLIACLLMVSSAFGYGNLRKYAAWLIPSVALLIFFAVYSYAIREQLYFSVRGLADYDYEKVADTVMSLSTDDVLGRYLPSVVDRVVGYGDGLSRLVEGQADRGDPLYALGSFVEVGNLVPRFIWEGRPHLSFNHHVTGAVWGQYGLLSETPIGRIGEAFYVGGWIGLTYGLLYGALLGAVGMAWSKLRRSVWDAAFTISILLMWALPDAYVTYGLKQVIVALAVWRLGVLFIGSAMQSVARNAWATDLSTNPRGDSVSRRCSEGHRGPMLGRSLVRADRRGLGSRQ